MPETTSKRFGTAPVFITAISTILGAILFLRFGFAVGTLGFWGVIAIIILGHMVTIPTAMAISELATNKRVEGGGEYFIISRSFGLNIGAAIGFALYLSQAISVAFYVIAFTEAFEFLFKLMQIKYSIILPRQIISIPAMTILAILILKRGANLGVKALYIVAGILAISLITFFVGTTEYNTTGDFSITSASFRNSTDFFMVFAIIFPAFTGMTAGVGLSGELKKPSKSIPIGTMVATIMGMIIYIFVVYKLAASATIDELLNEQLVMGKIAIGGAVLIPIGLAASTISSALGSIMVAPRTLQALALDKSFPIPILNNWIAKSRKKDDEPINASIITIIIAYLFVAAGNVNAVAEIISMFFMVTYGTLCLISFLHHFGSSPSYRPSFRSKWQISLIGFFVSFWVMFKINTPYAIAALTMMILLYLLINKIHKNRKGFENIYANSLFQLNRNLQTFIQQKRDKNTANEWRPSAICISKHTFERNCAIQILEWVSYRFGFGTYLHHISGYYSKSTVEQADKELKEILKSDHVRKNHVYIDTIISPSNTSAIAQAIQIPGIAGMENNLVLFEYEKGNSNELQEVIENIPLVSAGNFDIAVYSSNNKATDYKKGIHLWIKTSDHENANLLILMSFIISGHPDWKKADIKIFEIVKPDEAESANQRMKELVLKGRLPITNKNIEIIIEDENTSPKTLINQHSKDAALTLIGFRTDALKHMKHNLFEGYDKLNNILFLCCHSQKTIE